MMTTEICRKVPHKCDETKSCQLVLQLKLSWQRDETALISTGHHLFLPNSFIFQNPVVHIQTTVAASVGTETDPTPLQEIISFSKLQV